MYTKEYFEGGDIGNYSKNSDYIENQHLPYCKALLNIVLNYKNSGKLLEVGCAYGYFLRIAESYFETYGLDISQYAIEQAQNIAKNTKFAVGDIEKDIEFFPKIRKFNVIIALDIFEHLSRPEDTIKKCYNLLDKDGYLFFRVPNTDCIDFKFYSLIGKSERWHGYDDKTHISLLELSKWENIVKCVGFEYNLLPYFPTRLIRKVIVKKYPDKYFLPSQFSIINKCITIMCKKK